VHGRRVGVIVGDHRAGGSRALLTWDGRDRRGRPLPGGIYFMRLRGAPDRAQKVVLMR
jgi:hypothetical protein